MGEIYNKGPVFTGARTAQDARGPRAAHRHLRGDLSVGRRGHDDPPKCPAPIPEVHGGAEQGTAIAEAEWTRPDRDGRGFGSGAAYRAIALNHFV